MPGSSSKKAIYIAVALIVGCLIVGVIAYLLIDTFTGSSAEKGKDNVELITENGILRRQK